MSMTDDAGLRRLPSVDEVLRADVSLATIEQFGRLAAVKAVRDVLADARAKANILAAAEAAIRAHEQLAARASPRLKQVYNLTGTVLHTNLGRALLAEPAVEAASAAMRNAVALEFDLENGRRGERDDLLRDLLCELTGAEDATVVNNNAAAVLLALNTFTLGRDAIVSRGELIEIGGAFRMPEIMARAGARLVEVGTTNRTHARDYVEVIGAQTGLVLKVHTSNYRIQGFTKDVAPRELVAIAHKHNVTFAHDLGSGTLVDLRRLGLPHEPTVAEAVADGADLVMFSGDKLLGGPQAGFIVGRKAMLAQINRNPMKRALRIDKIRLAALEATLKLYRDPERLAVHLPTMRHLARPVRDIDALAHRLAPALAGKLTGFEVEVIACTSQIGSGALPLETLPSAGLSIRFANARGGGHRLAALARSFRKLPVPVIGRLNDRAFVLDLRCLDDEMDFVTNLAALACDAEEDSPPGGAP